MRVLSVPAAVTIAMLAAAAPATGHHSFAAQFDADQPVTLAGTVTKVEWQNPHIWVYLDVAGADGQVAAWECEGDNPNNLTRRGWTKDSVEVGKPITIYGFQARNGASVCNGRTWVFDGRTVYAAANDGGPAAGPPPGR